MRMGKKKWGRNGCPLLQVVARQQRKKMMMKKMMMKKKYLHKRNHRQCNHRRLIITPIHPLLDHTTPMAHGMAHSLLGPNLPTLLTVHTNLTRPEGEKGVSN
jgi:hypothetical protein